jgi:hypothetical protein
MCGPAFFFSVEYGHALCSVISLPQTWRKIYTLTLNIAFIDRELHFPVFPVRVSFPLSRLACTLSLVITTSSG